MMMMMMMMMMLLLLWLRRWLYDMNTSGLSTAPPPAPESRLRRVEDAGGDGHDGPRQRRGDRLVLRHVRPRAYLRPARRARCAVLSCARCPLCDASRAARLRHPCDLL